MSRGKRKETDMGGSRGRGPTGRTRTSRAEKARRIP